MTDLVARTSEIVALYQGGASCCSIARRFGVFTSSITDLLNRNGVRAAQPRNKPRLSSERQREVAERYAAGEQSGQLSKEFGVKQATIREIAKRHGALVRKIGVPKRGFTHAERAEIGVLYSQGVAYQEIADKYGTHAKLVVSLLVEDGRVKPRNKRHRHIDVSGYVVVKLSGSDPMASVRNSSGYALEHRLVMSRSLGRPVLPTETVHHIDGNKTNNDIDNLQLRQGRHGNGVCLTCADCGSVNIKAIPIDEPKAAE
jgi:hypothetical protein